MKSATCNKPYVAGLNIDFSIADAKWSMVLIPRSLLFSSLDLERSNSEIPNNLKGGIRLKVFQKRHHRSQLLSHRTDTRIHSRFRAINRIGRKEDRKKKRSRFERKKVFQSNIL